MPPEERLLALTHLLHDRGGTLPEDQRAALVLREFQQLSYEEIANALQQPEGTIKSRINRAREKVKNFVRQAEQNGCPSVKENEGRQK